MAFIVGLLTVVIVVDCALLTLLVLIQLPKKEAGAGVAFGGAATDALFGAGSGNVLTKATKYAAVAFFALAVVLSVLQTRLYHQGESKFREELQQQGQTPPPAAVPPAVAMPEGTNAEQPIKSPLQMPNVAATNSGVLQFGNSNIGPISIPTNAAPAPGSPQ